MNKELVEIIRKDEKTLKGDPEKENDLGKLKTLELKKKKLSTKINQKNKQFTDVARIISANTSGVSARNYNKRNAEIAFKKLEQKQILSKEEQGNYSLTLKQLQKNNLNLINKANTQDIEQICSDAKDLLKKTVESVAIERLKENDDISKWVEEGLKLHEEKESKSCEFCNQPLPEKRIAELMSYFNDADKELKNNIDTLLNRVRQLYSSADKLQILDKANLYDEFQEYYSAALEEVDGYKRKLLKGIEKLGKLVKSKKQKTTEQLDVSEDINPKLFISAIDKANSFIVSHNAKTSDFNAEKEIARANLENHYLSEIYDEVNDFDNEIEAIKVEIKNLEDGDIEDKNHLGIKAIEKRIVENKNKISTSGTACTELNQQLKTFLGRDEIVFQVVENGYEIKRNGKTAKNLSEGEKTAIAFVYFTIHLKDKDFDIENGIVVIDDPISSLDSNSLFQAFSFLKNVVKGAQQVFLLTHNFDFLKLLIGWLKRVNGQFYMIKNTYDKNNHRVATLDVLDSLLKKYSNEYQYLFKLLLEFKTDGTIASVYHIPNIARKTLENFLMIMVPNSINLFNKMEQINFDVNKKTAIYKFTNDQSHTTGNGFDPSLVAECPNNVKYLLEMIEAVFPDHYKILKECSQ